MSGYRIQAHYEQLKNMSRDLAHFADITTALHYRIHNVVDRLMAGDWTGLGAEQFFREMSDLVYPGMDRLAEALQYSSEATTYISKIFQDAEDEAGKLFRGASSGFEGASGGQPAASPKVASYKDQGGTPTPPQQQQQTWNPDIDKQIKAICSDIKGAASYRGVDPALVAAIIYDEISRRDAGDDIQDNIASGIFGSTLSDTSSLGIAQMQIQVVQELADKGYIDIPDMQNQLGRQLSKKEAIIQLLLNPSFAPHLVAARIQQTIDTWKKGGVDISNRPEILGTLYSIGLTGSSGVNPNPQSNERGDGIKASIDHMNDLLKDCK